MQRKPKTTNNFGKFVHLNQFFMSHNNLTTTTKTKPDWKIQQTNNMA